MHGERAIVAIAGLETHNGEPKTRLITAMQKPMR